MIVIECLFIAALHLGSVPQRIRTRPRSPRVDFPLRRVPPARYLPAAAVMLASSNARKRGSPVMLFCILFIT